MLRALLLALLILGFGGVACTRGPLLDRAIEIQGAGLDRWTRTAEVRVYHALPGVWEWEMAFLAPDHFRVTLLTAGRDQHYLYDGETLRAFIGSAEISSTKGADAEAFASHARWMSVISLAPLRGLEGIEVEDLSPVENSPTVGRRLQVRFADGDLYRLGFDADGRLALASGPIVVPAVGKGDLSARFLDYRRVGSFEIPFGTRYSLDGEPLFDERVTRFVPQDPSLGEHSFVEVSEISR